jgi:DNA-directed RNA polymerase subunit N (RpoN/RPB10)
MPQDDPRTEKDSSRQQRGGARAEQMRSENVAAAEQISARMAEISTSSLKAGLRMQTEMFDTLQTIGRRRRCCRRYLRSSSTPTMATMRLRCG